jgi:prophage antirepressor-like protein
MNFDEDEKVVRTTYSSNSGNPDTIFLSSQGVYRLLYNSKKEIAKKFRKWAGNILDDIIFNESDELKLQIENQKLLLEQEKETNKTLTKALNTRSLYNNHYYRYISNKLEC